ncbi:hypothetical protein ACFWMR_07415 [Amycolatopsis thailandensis]|uniref:hypothetical protein n=1 Tax=Amycolatopsis thailandensis TaxID=589330 RepID=UPI003653E00B
MTEPQPTYTLPPPFSACFEGWTPNPEDLEQWPNSVRVEVVEGYDPTFTGELTDEDLEYADYGEERHLVEIDTNYKPTRDSAYPVRLTRSDAVKLAAALLEAVEDTFHYSRCGRLRPAEAKDLLDAIRDTEHQLTELRDHALNDLLAGTGLTEDPLAVNKENQR